MNPSFYKEISWKGTHEQLINTQQLPVDSTLKRLTLKINEMSKAQNNSLKITQFNALQNRVQDIEVKVQQALKNVDKTIKLHKQTLIEMAQKISEIQTRNTLCKKVRANQIKQIQSKISIWINLEKKTRITIEQKILENFESKFQMLSEDFTKQIEARKHYLNSLDEKLARALPLLKTQIVQELEACCSSLVQIQKKLEDTTEDFKQALAKMQHQHNQKMSKVMELLNETVAEVKKQIYEEKSKRELKKNQIMELFEGAYKKLIL